MRILFVTTSYVTLRAFLMPLAMHFRERGWQVDGMAEGVTTDPDCTTAFDKTWEMAWSRNPLAANNLLSEPHKIRAVVREQHYDLVHVHTPVASFVTRFALRNRMDSKPMVFYTAHGFHFYHGGPFVPNLIYRFLEKMAGKWTDHLVVINQEDHAAALRYRIVPPENLHYMPGIGVDTEIYKADRVPDERLAALRSELGLREEDNVFLMVAEFIPRKRHLDLVRAFSRLCSPEVHLVLAGDGPMLTRVKQTAVDLGVEKNVHFPGYRKDIQALMKAAVATILPSEREGLPRCLMESLCMKTPVIAADIRGVSDLLSGSQCGFMFKTGDLDGLVSAMRTILADPRAAREMGENGRRLMEATYGIKKIIALHERLYATALSEGGRK